MYNYYSELKRINEYRSQIENEEKDKKIKEIRKKKMPILINKYENRLKDFLYKMAQSPKVIKDHQMAVTSTRKEFLDEENHKIRAGKGFVLKQFKTEKQRLQEQLSTKEALELGQNLLNLIPVGSELQNISQLSKSNVDNILKLKAFYDAKKKKLDSSKINQPNMRFTAKNNLERIFDALNMYSYGRLDKDELERKKKQLEIKKKLKNKEENSDDDDDTPDNTELAEKENEESINYKWRKRNGKKLNKIEDKKLKMKHDHNSQARHIMSELHERTHFKGASGFTLWKSTSLLRSKHEKIENNTQDNYNQNRESDHRNQGNTSWEKFQLRRLNSQITFTNNPISTKNNLENNPNKQKVQFEENLKIDTVNRGNKPDISNSNRANTVGNSERFFNKENSYRFEDYINNVDDSFNHNYLLNKLDIGDDLAQNNPLLYNLTINNYKKKYENRDETDAKNLNYLKKIAFDAELNKARKLESGNIGYFKKLTENKKSLRKKSLLQTDPIAFFEKYKENMEANDFSKPNNLEKKLKIDGEDIPITELDRIAKKVLVECNFVHPKNKNNQIFHKSGEGKLMITSGMTVKDFISKYNLK